MRAGTAVCSAFISFFVFVAAGKEVIQVNATVGENVTLPCETPTNNKITAVEWSRPGRETQCVFLYWDGQIDADSQNPIFKNRVDLQDKDMKDGDVSVILKNVMIKDTGTYKCRVKREDYSVELVSIIYLRVAPPGPTGGTTEDGGSVGLIVGLSGAALVAAVVGFVIYRKCKRQSRHQDAGSSQRPDEEQSSEMYLQLNGKSPAADPDSVLSVNSGKEG